MSLRSASISGIKWLTTSNIVCMCSSMVQVAVLARYLTPSDFGLMAMAQIVLGFSQAFADMGVSGEIIRRTSLNFIELSSLYWLNVAASSVMALLIFSISPLIGEIYKADGLSNILSWVSITFLIQSLGQQFSLLLQRDLHFKDVSIIEIVSSLFGLIVAITAAMSNHGVYSLVFGQISSCTCSTVMLLGKQRRYSKVRFLFRYSAVQPFLSFGFYQMAEKTINYFNYQIDSIIVGILLGPADAGIYTLAKQIVMRPTSLINPVVNRISLPIMSKIQDKFNLGIFYAKIVACIATINFTIYGFMFLFSPEIVSIYLGETWLGVSQPLRLLCIWAAIRSTGNPIGSLLVAKGLPKRAFWWNLGLFFFIPATVWIGSRFGVKGISCCLILSAMALIVPSWFYLIRPCCDLLLIKFMISIIRPGAIVSIAVICAWMFGLSINDLRTRAILMAAVLICIWCVLTYFFNRIFVKDTQSMIKSFYFN